MLTIETIKRLEYVGGGYFRLPGPVGKKTLTIHAPALVSEILMLLEARNEAT